MPAKSFSARENCGIDKIREEIRTFNISLAARLHRYIDRACPEPLALSGAGIATTLLERDD